MRFLSVGMLRQAVDVLPYEEEKKKPRSEVKIYDREELEAFQEVPHCSSPFT